ncbi:MAG: N5-glutamine methyltransferase family protein [Nitriliruptorales bacterium]
MTVVSAGTPLQALVREHEERLRAAGVDSPDRDALALACHALGLSPLGVRTASAEQIAPHALGRLEELVARRGERVPLQHLTGEAGFRALVLECRPGVFVPRAETEVLAGRAIDLARSAVAERGRAVVAEPCTGSGAVALAVAAEVVGVQVMATDLSRDAVTLAGRNLARVAAEPGIARGSTCSFAVGDLLEPLPADLRGRLDVVVANPPYLTESEVAAAAPEVRDHDPAAALIAAEEGNAIIDLLLADGLRWLRPGGALALEIPEARAQRHLEAARSAGYDDADLIDDLTGRERVLVARTAVR